MCKKRNDAFLENDNREYIQITNNYLNVVGYCIFIFMLFLKFNDTIDKLYIFCIYTDIYTKV